MRAVVTNSVSVLVDSDDRRRRSFTKASCDDGIRAVPVVPEILDFAWCSDKVDDVDESTTAQAWTRNNANTVSLFIVVVVLALCSEGGKLLGCIDRSSKLNEKRFSMCRRKIRDDTCNI